MTLTMIEAHSMERNILELTSWKTVECITADELFDVESIVKGKL